jgi:hypothetical protein
MAWKVVCGLCAQEHTARVESYATAVSLLAVLAGDARRRGLPDDLLALLHVVPQTHVYSGGRWVEPGGEGGL